MTKLNLSNWYVLRVRTGLEGKTRVALGRIGLGSYAPERRVEWQHRRTKKWQERSELLMPGYMFIEMPPASEAPSWRAIVSCDGVVAPLGLVGADGGVVPMPIPGRLVERLIAAQSGMEFDDTREAKRRRGQTRENALAEMCRRMSGAEVMVIDGPLRSFSAVVDEIDSLTRIKVLVAIFGRLTPMWVEPWQVELLAA